MGSCPATRKAPPSSRLNSSPASAIHELSGVPPRSAVSSLSWGNVIQSAKSKPEIRSVTPLQGCEDRLDRVQTAGHRLRRRDAVELLHWEDFPVRRRIRAKPDLGPPHVVNNTVPFLVDDRRGGSASWPASNRSDSMEVLLSMVIQSATRRLVLGMSSARCTAGAGVDQRSEQATKALSRLTWARATRPIWRASASSSSSMPHRVARAPAT